MKKQVMLAVKGAVGLLPLAVKQKLRQNLKLKAWYSTSLQKSGLFYGVPSRKKLRSLYKRILDQQKAHLSSLQSPAEETPVSFLIWSTQINSGNIVATLKNLSSQCQLIKKIIILAKEESFSLPSGGPEIIIVNSVSDLQSAVRGIDKIFCINAGDQLVPNGARYLSRLNRLGDIIYFDTDHLTENGEREYASLLPDWNPELQMSTGYINTAVCIHSPFELWEHSPLSDGFSSIAPWLACIAQSNTSIKVSHQPLSIVQRASINNDYLQLADELKRCLASDRVTLFSNQPDVVKVLWHSHSSPLVSLIIPTKNGHGLVKACIESILDKTLYQNYEILLIDNNSDDPASLAYFDKLSEHPKIRLLRYPHPFNYSAINNFGVKHAKGEIVGLINNDIEVISPDWLDYMVGHATREEIGCVGAKLIYSDGRVQHAGVVMGYGGGAGHAHKYFPRHHPGYMNRLSATQNYSAVTAACLLVKRTLYEKVNGLNEHDLHVAFNDVDFCLKVLELGVRNVYCAEAELYHHESISRGLDVTPEKAARFNRELTYLQTTWAKYIQHDPAYNPNLTLKRENFSIKEASEFK